MTSASDTPSGSAPSKVPRTTGTERLPEIVLAATVPLAVVRQMVSSGRWRRVRRGAYVDAHYLDAGASSGGARTPSARREALARIAAVVADARRRGGDVVLSHESAALIWGLPLWRMPAKTHVISPHRRSVRAAGDVAGHVVSPGDRDVVQRGGVLVTGLERTTLDIACERPPADALVVADAALRRGASRDALESLVARRAGRRGVARAREILAMADGGAESPWESYTRLHIAAVGLPAPRLQVTIPTRLGEFRGDLGWDEWRALVEFDGLVKFTDLSRGDPGRVLFEEKRRQDAIQEAGWRVLRVTSADFRDREALHRRLLSLAPPATRAHLTPRPHLLPPLASRSSS